MSESQQKASTGSNRRRADREPVVFPTVWDHRRLESQPGELRDVSNRGFFLRPQGGTVRFRPNDVVWGKLTICGEERPFRAVVRWRGWSREHRCVGLGLQLEEDCALTDEEVRAIRWPQDAEGRPALRLMMLEKTE